MKRLIFLFTLFVIATPVFSQNLNEALKDFLNTPFMFQYQKTQLEMERLTKDFIADKEQFTKQDIRRVRHSYITTSKELNKALEEIKNDFLNKNTLKVIALKPEWFNDRLKIKMIEIKEVYANDFLQTLSDVRGESVNGGPFIQNLVTLTRLTMSIVDYCVNLKQRRVKFNDEFLKDRLITPYSLPTWEQLTSPIESVSHSNLLEENY